MNQSRTLVCLWNSRWSLLRPIAVRDFLLDPAHDIGDIIFSGWHTRWPHHSSEAEQMDMYFRSIWRPNSTREQHKIILEEKSCDTEQNAIQVKKILGSTKLQIYLITSELKLIRSLDVFERHWFDAIGFAAEKIIAQNGTLLAHEILEQKKKEEMSYERFLEPAARLAMRSEFVRAIVSNITQQRLH